MQWKLFHHFSIHSIHCHQNSYKLPPYLFRPLQKVQPHPPHALHKKETKVFLHDLNILPNHLQEYMYSVHFVLLQEKKPVPMKRKPILLLQLVQPPSLLSQTSAITHGSPHIPREVFPTRYNYPGLALYLLAIQPDLLP